MTITWEGVQHGFQMVAALSAFFMHYILINLIVYHSPKGIGQYKYLMLLISIFEVIYALLDVIVQPIFHSFGATFALMISFSSNQVNKPFWEILGVIYCGFFGSSMAIFTIHYIYRYWVVSSNKDKLNWFKGNKVFLWFIGPLISGLTWTFVGYFTCYARKSSSDYLRESVKVKLGLDIDKIAYFAPYFYDRNETTGQEFIFWPSFIGITLDSISINISLVFSIYYGVGCWRRIQRVMGSSSAQHQALENQLFYALVAQTAIPIALMHIPALALFMFSFFEIEAGHFSGVVSMTIALFPALDPIPTILIISNYRNAVSVFISTKIQKFKKSARCLKRNSRSVQPYKSSTANA